MKTYIKIIIIALIFVSCSNDDNKPSKPVDQLPPATQTGAQTIGCLVNGVPFTDSGVMNNFYQLIDGEYYMVINWFRNTSQGYKSGQIAINRIQIEEGQTYILNHCCPIKI
jgi:PBP1b-binding outer membrane lipoprotein LpoB